MTKIASSKKRKEETKKKNRLVFEGDSTDREALRSDEREKQNVGGRPCDLRLSVERK